MWIRSLDQKDPLEEAMATLSSTLAWRIPWTEEDPWATIHRVAKSQTQLKRLSTHTCTLTYSEIYVYSPTLWWLWKGPYREDENVLCLENNQYNFIKYWLDGNTSHIQARQKIILLSYIWVTAWKVACLLLCQACFSGRKGWNCDTVYLKDAEKK